MSFKSHSPAQTRKMGQRIGRALQPGDVVAVSGQLGAGKTTFIKGLGRGLGVAEKRISSPTFVLIHEYVGREKIYHMDWYRLDSLAGPDADLVAECFEEKAVCLVEWPERGRGLLPKRCLAVAITHLRDPRSRQIAFSGPADEKERFEILKKS